MCVSKTQGVGASVSWNLIDNDTKAFIGDIDASDGTAHDPRGVINAGEDVSISALSKELIVAVSVAGGIAVDTGSTTEATTDAGSEKSEEKFGFGVAGDISFNLTQDETLAYIADGVDVNAGGAVTLDARNELFDVAVGGSLGVGENLGIGVSLSNHVIVRNAKAYTQDAKITADSLSVTATTDDKMFEVAMSASGTKKDGASVAASVYVNVMLDLRVARCAANTRACGASAIRGRGCWVGACS